VEEECRGMLLRRSLQFGPVEGYMIKLTGYQLHD